MVKRIARARGFIDPIAVLGQLHRFQQPSEVAEPLELLRAGVVFHARGLINTKVIQHNLDWVWPYWVERQFDPHDESFIPRAFSITHVNLSHRNWTAVGLPNGLELPVIDPRGLVMPFWDSWTIDAWVIADNGSELIPSRLEQVNQKLLISGGVAVTTSSSLDGLRLDVLVNVMVIQEVTHCVMEIRALSDTSANLVISVRPYNPEGISFVHDILLREDLQEWLINGDGKVVFDTRPDSYLLSDYLAGDVYYRLHDKRSGSDTKDSIKCEVGMATGAALFSLEESKLRTVNVMVPLEPARMSLSKANGGLAKVENALWEERLNRCAGMSVPDELFNYLYDCAVRTLILHAPGDVYPGPYTYRRFWFRDAVFILNAMMAIGLLDEARRVIDSFPARQSRDGYFVSQAGEWDSNGQVLWIMHRYLELSKHPLNGNWVDSIAQGARWIERKRLRRLKNVPHAGLLPAGFSAEHLGPNDYYYWDNFWSVAGLRRSSVMLESVGMDKLSMATRAEADLLMEAIEESFRWLKVDPQQSGIPASPHRRMDAGAIGSIVVGYPLELWPAKDSRLLATANSLMKRSFVRGAFFQDMIHSGLNAYLTLHVAQVLLRAGDSRFFELVENVARLASPTGQWPEAIHPRTLGGCMGDGQHAWAAAEWILMLKNCFVREEGDRLILCSGLPRKWLLSEGELFFGPTQTKFGTIEVRVINAGMSLRVSWKAKWQTEPNEIIVCIAGEEPITLLGSSNGVELSVSNIN